MKKKLNIDFNKLENPEEQVHKVPGQNIEFMKEMGLNYQSDDEQDKDVIIIKRLLFEKNNDVFKFYTTISRLLYVYGDKQKPEQTVIKIVHSQIQELLSQLFSKQIIQELLQKCKSSTYIEYRSDIYNFSEESCETDLSTLVFSNVLKLKFKKVMQKYLYFVFSDFTKTYIDVTRNIQKVTSKCQDEQKLLFYEALNKRIKQRKVDQKVQQSLDQFESDQESLFQDFNEYSKSVSQYSQQSSLPWLSQTEEEEEEEAEAVDSQSSKDIQPTPTHLPWDKYMKHRIENMDLNEFEQFMKLRSRTFTQSKKNFFLTFLNQHGYGQWFNNEMKYHIRFLNYSLCRVIRQIVLAVFNVIGSVEFGGLNYYNTKKLGYRIIEKYCNRAKKYALTRQRAQTKAFKLFEKEFVKEGYEAFLSMKQSIKLIKRDTVTLHKNEVQDPTRVLAEWRNMKAGRNMWVDRVLAEKHLSQLSKKKLNSPNEYFDYLYGQCQESKLPYQQFRKEMPRLFKLWFLGIGRNIRKI